MKFGKWEFPDELLYDTHNQWVSIENSKIRFGFTPFGLEVTGEVLYLSLPAVGDIIQQNEGCGSLESGKWVGRVYAPVGGKVTAVNNAVLKQPRIVNDAPYENWLVEVEVTETTQFKNLMTASNLGVFLAKDLKKDA